MKRLILTLAIVGTSAYNSDAQSKKSAHLNFDRLQITSGKGPASVAITDLNSDGKRDIIVANAGGNSVTILLGDGKGHFSQPKGSPFPAGNSPNDIAVGDFNGDGRPDLAFPNHDTKYITVLLGYGSGRFGTELQTTVQSRPHPHGIAIGDFNGDRRLDVVVESWMNNQVELLVGKGDGTFQTPGTFFDVGKMPYQRLRCGDVNGDGKPDIITTNFEGNSVSVLLCDGNGGFSHSGGSPFTVAKSPFGVTIGDVNGDSKLDLAIVHYSGHGDDPGADGLSVLFGDGTGKFHVAPGSPFPTGRAPTTVAVDDMDGDGISDIAVANSMSNTVSMYLSGRTSFSQAIGSPIAVGRNPHITLGDLNGDGKADIVTANYDGNDVTVLLSK